jgi:(1->4)-alpha-D-glucan 1-alpha-D-glucosylmutase
MLKAALGDQCGERPRRVGSPYLLPRFRRSGDNCGSQVPLVATSAEAWPGPLLPSQSEPHLCVPYLKARPGSTHGYDIVDHGQLNPELGDATAFQEMIAAFRDSGLGQVLDFVPNRYSGAPIIPCGWMCWSGARSRNTPAGSISIGTRIDTVCRASCSYRCSATSTVQYWSQESGQLVLRFERETDGLAVWAYDTQKLPICPLLCQRVLGDERLELERLGGTFSGLLEWRPRIAQCARDLQAELGALARHRSDVQQAIQASIESINGTPGQLDSWRELDL